MAQLELREPSEGDFHPEYSGIDWYALRMRKLGQMGLQAAECWFVIEEEDGVYEQQITQENTHISYNFTDPNVDCVSIMDNRDGDAWYWFRGDKNMILPFEELVETIGPFAMRVASMYPRPQIANIYEKRLLRALEADLETGFEESYGD